MLYWLFTKMERPVWLALTLATVWFLASDIAAGETFWTLAGLGVLAFGGYQLMNCGRTTR